jgi:ComEC/Rec2-related protein
VGRTLELAGDQGNLLVTMLYGYRDDLDRELRDAFRRAGVGHVLAISGLHVGLLAGLLWWVGGWLSLSLRVKSAGCLVLSFFYLGLAGGQVAASRATLMLGIHFLGGIAGRKSDMLNSLGAAALLLTFINPSAPSDVSFQLSFTAIVFIHASIRRGPAGERRPPAPTRSGPGPWLRRRLREDVLPLTYLSLATWIGLFPIIALVFKQVNLVGLPINIVVIPLMSLVLAGGLLLPWLGWLPGCAWLLCLPSRALVELTLAADRLPYASFSCHAPTLPALALFYLAVFVFLLRGLARDRIILRRWRNASLAGVGLSFLILLASMASEPPPPGGRITALPGRRGFGSLVAESANGAAVIGDWDRGGENEAAWLHSQRRGGAIGVLGLNRPGKNNLSVLAYHYPLAEATFLPRANRKEAGRRLGWRPVPGAAGVDYAFRRDRSGSLVWLAARAGENSICLAPNLTVGRLETFRRDAEEMGFQLLILSLYKGGWEDRTIPEFSGLVAASGPAAPLGRPGWFSRRAYGALRLSGELMGFVDGEWKKIEPSSKELEPAAPLQGKDRK